MRHKGNLLCRLSACLVIIVAEVAWKFLVFEDERRGFCTTEGIPRVAVHKK